MAMESISLQVEKFTKDKSAKAAKKVMESVSMRMVGSMKECGSKIVK